MTICLDFIFPMLPFSFMISRQGVIRYEFVFEMKSNLLINYIIKYILPVESRNLS